MKNNPLIGYFYTFLAFLIWGLLPVYWKQLSHVTALEILVNRILWTFVILFILVLIKYRQYILQIIKTNKGFKYLLVSAVFLGTNWYLFIYAISINRILDASLGYYINPLVSVLLGVIFLKEKLPKPQIVAVILAMIGVLYLTLNFGRLPLLSLTLAFSFGSYGLIRKKINIKPIPAVMIESLLLFPLFLLIFILSIDSFQEIMFFNSNPYTIFLLIGAGVVTLVPLVFYGQGVTMIPLKSVGFIQYITPTFMLLIGTIIYGEPFTTVHLISFVFIWVALGIYTWSVFRR
ncbi:MAG: EamA family transporter RarD [Fidelibacterota bacterium]